MDMKSKLSFLFQAASISFVTLLSCEGAFGNEIDYSGMCNASAAVSIGCNEFIVADDEDNKLRIYRRNAGLEPIQTIPLPEVFKGEIKEGDGEEIDIEGAAELDKNIYWIGSHSTNKKGKLREARHRLFAVHVESDADKKFKMVKVGKIYSSLIDDLVKDERFDKYHFIDAKNIAPKSIGGLSIEGLAATSEGPLMIGFRSPLVYGKIEQDRLVNGKALIITLLNPSGVVQGEAAVFGNPIELDLGGYGVRSIEKYRNNGYLIAAGPYHENVQSSGKDREKTRLYLWSGKSGEDPIWLDQLDLAGLNIEAAYFHPVGSSDRVQLLSDDGEKKEMCGNKFCVWDGSIPDVAK